MAKKFIPLSTTYVVTLKYTAITGRPQRQIDIRHILFTIRYMQTIIRANECSISKKKLLKYSNQCLVITKRYRTRRQKNNFLHQ